MLKVLGKTSSINVRKVLWACDELQLSYEVEEWGEGFGNTESEHYQALNPNGLVPTLIDGDFVLWESNTIIRYLASEYGSGELLPQHSKSRALVEKWMDWQATEFNSSWRYAFQALVRKNPDFSNKNEIEVSLRVWARHIGILDDQLVHTGGHVADAEFTLADIPIGLSVNRWFMTPADKPSFPAVDAYYELLSKRSAFMRHGRNGVA